jgi:hypothetical protein
MGKSYSGAYPSFTQNRHRREFQRIARPWTDLQYTSAQAQARELIPENARRLLTHRTQHKLSELSEDIQEDI